MLEGEIPPPPVAELVGMQVTEVGPGRVVFVLEPAEFHLNPNGVLHGGIAALICDTACGCAVTTELPPGETCATLEIKVNYLRPVGVGTERLTCTGNGSPPRPALGALRGEARRPAGEARRARHLDADALSSRGPARPSPDGGPGAVESGLASGSWPFEETAR